MRKTDAKKKWRAEALLNGPSCYSFRSCQLEPRYLWAFVHLRRRPHDKIRLMPVNDILELLIEERDRISRAIEALQGPTKRRGRPPKKSAPAPAVGDRPAGKKRTFSVAQRKAMSKRMKARWAAKKKAS